jgi:hypothetical protein
MVQLVMCECQTSELVTAAKQINCITVPDSVVGQLQ